MTAKEKNKMAEQIVEAELDGWGFGDLYEFVFDAKSLELVELDEIKLLKEYENWFGEPK